MKGFNNSSVASGLFRHSRVSVQKKNQKSQKRINVMSCVISARLLFYIKIIYLFVAYGPNLFVYDKPNRENPTLAR